MDVMNSEINCGSRANQAAHPILLRFKQTVGANRFHAALERATEQQRSVPYHLHMFAEAKILFDVHGSVTPVIDEIKEYPAAHPEIQEEWIHLEEFTRLIKGFGV